MRVILLKRIRSIFKGNLGGALLLSLGSVFSQGINILIQPLLTRLFTPSELGQYSYILSIANLFLPIASFNLTNLIVSSQEKDEVDLLVDVSIYSTFVTTLFYLIFVLLFNNFFIYNNNELFYLVFLTPVIIISNGIYQVYLSVENWQQHYKKMTILEIYKIGAMSSMQVLSGIIKVGVTGLLLGKLISPFFYIFENRRNLIQTLLNFNVRNYINTLKKFFNHIIFSVPSQFLNTFSYSLILLSISNIFSEEEVGFYSVSVRVLGVPILLISYNLSKIYLKKISVDKNENRSLYKTYTNIVKKLTLLSFVTFFSIAIVSPFISEFIFGEGYGEAGIYISILCLMFFVRMIASPLSGTFIILNKQNIQFYLNNIFIILGIAAYFIANIYSLNIYEYLSVVSVFYSLSYAINLIYIGKQCKKWDYDNIES